MFNQSHLNQLQTTGLLPGDFCTVHSIAGRKKSLKLLRTQLDIFPSSVEASSYESSQLLLPMLRPTSFHYRLELEELHGHSCFVLKTLKGSPFVINGQICRESFVEANDSVLIGESRLDFKKETLQEELNHRNDHVILKDNRAVKSTLPFFIIGETGTGKSRLAELIHNKSGRRGKFIHVNLSSFAPQLIESELFGHKKGAFTGATSDRLGAFREAQYGTLFLDEIDSLSLELQTKLLLFLDSQKIRPVGDTIEYSLETRLIFASGRSPQQLVEQKLMRIDFYYRLSSGISLKLSPLREDPEQIRRFCEEFGLKEKISISEKLIQFYFTLPWQGNFRQLKGHLQMKKQLSKGIKIDFDEWDEKLMLQSSNLEFFSIKDLNATLIEVKQHYAQEVLRQCHGNGLIAAKKLGISLKTLKGLVT